MSSVLTTTNLPGIERVASGKVRDIYAVHDDKLGDLLLIVATDRISAFDCILPQGIPGKGRLLTQMSLFWFDFLRDIVPNHLVTADVDAYPAPLRAFRDQIEGRSMLVRRCRIEPIECVARGYISGSGWKDYQKTGAICGIALPEGLRESDKLPEAIFTPSTKATTGHDENISFEETVAQIGRPLAEKIRDTSLTIYREASERAAKRGIIIADTKFEFGLIGDQLIWIDEALTPDSSRFWPADQYVAGKAQPSFDKQYVRDYLERIGWNKQPPGPALPEDVVKATTAKYREAYEKVTGHPLD